MVSYLETRPTELEWIYERETNGQPMLDLSILESLSFRFWKEGYLPVECILRSSPKLKNLCCTCKYNHNYWHALHNILILIPVDEYGQHSLHDLSQVLVIALPTLRSLTLEWCKFGVSGYFGSVAELITVLSCQPNYLDKICISLHSPT